MRFPLQTVPHYLRSNPIRLLIVAGAFHVVLSITVFLVGHFQLLPNNFNAQGIGISFTIDSEVYRVLATDMSNVLKTRGISAWIAVRSPLHCRLYSLSFTLFGGLVGYDILAAEPLNLFYYLGILTVVYLLGREIFSPDAGLLAAAIVGIWPSFLLHSIQLMRDPLAILSLLAWLLVLTISLGRELSWRQSLMLGLGGILLITTFWLARSNMWNVFIASVVITIVLLAIRMLRERKILKWNLIFLLLASCATLAIPPRIESTSLSGTPAPSAIISIPSASRPVASDEGLWTRIIRQIGARRAGFRFYGANGSNIDSQVRLRSTTDVLKYLPRAAMVGFFAPFPKMWLETGAYGRSGRLLSGLETLMMYLLYIPALICFWHERRRLTTWLIVVMASTGLIALGLTVVNAAALFRLRYVFWMMVIIVAAEGILFLVKRKGWESRT